MAIRRRAASRSVPAGTNRRRMLGGAGGGANAGEGGRVEFKALRVASMVSKSFGRMISGRMAPRGLTHWRERRMGVTPGHHIRSDRRRLIHDFAGAGCPVSAALRAFPRATVAASPQCTSIILPASNASPGSLAIILCPHRNARSETYPTRLMVIRIGQTLIKGKTHHAAEFAVHSVSQRHQGAARRKRFDAVGRMAAFGARSLSTHALTTGRTCPGSAVGA